MSEPTIQWLLVSAIIALSGVVTKLYKDAQECRDDRLNIWMALAKLNGTTPEEIKPGKKRR